MTPLVFEVPMKAPSTPNLREHWSARDKRNASQKAAVFRQVPVLELPPAYEVRLVRIGVRRLDSDNLAGALKGVRDAVARRLRVDDGSTLVLWSYSQETDARGRERVRIEVAKFTGSLPGLSEDADVWSRPRMRALLDELRAATGVPPPARTKAPEDETPAERVRRLARPASYPRRRP